MPPKRRAPTAAAPPSTTPNPTPRPSKLAKENNLTAAQETEIKEAFTIFAVPASPRSSSSPAPPTNSSKGKAAGKAKEELFLPTKELRRALTALGTPPCDAAELRELLDTVDPDGEGRCDYATFLAVAALKFHSRSDESVEQEVEEAWRLFVSHNSREGGGAGEERITLKTLKRIARVLKLEGEVGEGVLGDMILEANGGRGVGRGVGRGEFEGVIRRAGVIR